MNNCTEIMNPIEAHTETLEQDSLHYIMSNVDYCGSTRDTLMCEYFKAMSATKEIISRQSVCNNRLNELAISVVSDTWGIPEDKLDIHHIRCARSIMEYKQDFIDTQKTLNLKPSLKPYVEKRRILNSLSQAAATHNMMSMYLLASSELRQLMPVSDKYPVDILSRYRDWVFGAMSAYMSTDEQVPDSVLVNTAIGVCQVVSDGDGSGKVLAYAPVFPLLPHELVKGTVDLINLRMFKDLSNDDIVTIMSASDGLWQEFKDIKRGIGLWNKFLQHTGPNFVDNLVRLSKSKPEDVFDELENVLSEKSTNFTPA